eukprot:Lithocolla_globosa_v1_NODE_7184_length_982_cov_4.464941.p1 type:complete len:215 gc:universal NODE_7184_length_982_cov_4.464941:35-679(+)
MDFFGKLSSLFIGEDPKIKRYEVQKELNHGGFSTVFVGLDTKTGEKVAVKRINKQNLKDDAKARVLREVEVHSRCKHNNIIEFKDFYETKTHYFLILEIATDGDLFDKISVLVQDNKCLSEDEARSIFIQVLRGVQYMHENGVVHRDIKAENVVFSGKEAKLCDFGFAKLLEKNQVAQTPCGSPGIFFSFLSFFSSFFCSFFHPLSPFFLPNSP